MTIDDNIKALRHCLVDGDCEFCPRFECPTNNCQDELFEDIKTYIDFSRHCEAHWVKLTGAMPPEFHFKHFCSRCNSLAPHNYGHEKLTEWCPCCGAHMIEKENGDAKTD